MVSRRSSRAVTKRLWWVGIGSAIAVTGGMTLYTLPLGLVGDSEVTADSPALSQVVALGQLVPISEVINLSAPLVLEGDRIGSLEVQTGDAVQVGQVLAVLDSRDRLERLRRQAQAGVSIAQRRLAQVQAGAESGEVAAQQANVTQLQSALSGEVAVGKAVLNRLQAELRNASTEFERLESLHQVGAVSASQLDAQRLVLETVQAQVKEAEALQAQRVDTLSSQIAGAEATLDQVVEVKPEDIAVAQAELAQAIAEFDVAAANVEQAYVRSPISGKVLKVLVRPGEKVNETGIVSLGKTDQMMVTAEVDESDIQQIEVGQSAQVTGDAFEGVLAGEVSAIGPAVSRQSVLSDQPGTNVDNRVIEVKVMLSPDASEKVAGLTFLQVQVAIPTET
ncbi:MAG: HlyD family efflux transporter periplasmic adaptor subunit [Phormidesmis sp.]